jgi:hypothetical protein
VRSFVHWLGFVVYFAPSEISTVPLGKGKNKLDRKTSEVCTTCAALCGAEDFGSLFTRSPKCKLISKYLGQTTKYNRTVSTGLIEFLYAWDMDRI